MLGAVDERGQSKEPVYVLGPVLEKGGDFYVCDDTRLIHANYKYGLKGIFWYLSVLLMKKQSLCTQAYVANILLGKLGHHLFKEADCETLFSVSGYKLDPRRLTAPI